MIPIVFGVAAAAALLLSRDSRRDEIYSAGPPEQAPIDFLGEDRTGDSRAFARDVYVSLRQAGVTDRQIDQGYYLSGVPRDPLNVRNLFDAPIGSEDYRIHELEVFRTALDLYELAPDEGLRKAVADFPAKAKSFEQAARLRFYRNSDGKADPQTVKTQLDYLQRAVNLDRGNLEAMHRLWMLWPPSADREKIMEAFTDLILDKYGTPIENAVGLHIRDFEARDHFQTDPVEFAHTVLVEVGKGKFPLFEDVAFATKIYDELRHKKPDDPAHHLRYGLLKAYSGSPGQAEAAYRDAIETATSLPEPLPVEVGLAHFYLGLSLDQSSSLEAMDHYLRAIDFFKSRDSNFHSYAVSGLAGMVLRQAEKAMENKSLEKFLPALNELAGLAQEPMIYFLQGKILQENGKLKEAAEAYRQVLRMDSGAIAEEARSEIKRILATLGDDQEAKELRKRLAFILQPEISL